jgi:hypothetical protein
MSSDALTRQQHQADDSTRQKGSTWLAAATGPRRPVQPGDHARVLALAPRLTEGVADWRDPTAVHHAVSWWVKSSLDTADDSGRAVYVAVADGSIAGWSPCVSGSISPARSTPTSAN